MKSLEPELVSEDHLFKIKMNKEREMTLKLEYNRSKTKFNYNVKYGTMYVTKKHLDTYIRFVGQIARKPKEYELYIYLKTQYNKLKWKQ